MSNSVSINFNKIEDTQLSTNNNEEVNKNFQQQTV